MEYFDKNYFYIRNNFLIPKIRFGIKRNKYEYWNFKEVLTDKIISLKKLNGKSFEIEIPEQDYYKAIHCEIEMFYNKTVIHHRDLVNQRKISKTWSFVTLYYFAFFNITLLYRYLDKGFLWLYSHHTKKINDFSNLVNSEIISIDGGNYYFDLKGKSTNGNVLITLTYKGENVHKTSWNYFEQVLNDFINNSDKDELKVLDKFRTLFKNYKNEYPSFLRNKLNYNGESSIFDLKESIIEGKLIELDHQFLKLLSKIDISNANIDNMIKSTGYLSSYLFSLNNKLYDDFKERSTYGKDFQKERSTYLSK